MFFEIAAEEATNESSQPLLLSEGNESDEQPAPLAFMDSLSVRQWMAVAACVFLAFPILSAGMVGTTNHVSSNNNNNNNNNHDQEAPQSRLVSLLTRPAAKETQVSVHSSSSSSISNSIMSSNGVELDITVLGDPINIWRSPDTWQRCHQIDVPDIPTRAFWDSDSSRVRTIQGSTDYHIMTGPSLFHMTRQCHANWNHTANPDPSLFAANEFLDSPFAFSNGTVVAMAHTEYPGNRYNNCPGPAYPYCWTVTMGLMISHDFGITWDHAKPPPHHLVAAVPYVYNASQLAYGWGDPTNIMAHPTNGYFYMAAWNRNTVGLQPAGVCMMRTNALLDPASWRAWSGTDYNVSFESPYHNSGSDPKDHICTVLEVDTTVLDPTQCNPFGLVWSPSLELFVMTWGCLVGDGPFYLTTSKDLIQWSAPQFLYDRSMLPDAVGKNVTSLHYPNLMDVTAPTSTEFPPDHNYNTIGSTPHLFWVSFGHNVYSDGRSAWATPLKIQKKNQGKTTVQ